MDFYESFLLSRFDLSVLQIQLCLFCLLILKLFLLIDYSMVWNIPHIQHATSTKETQKFSSFLHKNKTLKNTLHITCHGYINNHQSPFIGPIKIDRKCLKKYPLGPWRSRNTYFHRNCWKKTLIIGRMPWIFQ